MTAIQLVLYAALGLYALSLCATLLADLPIEES